jgi:ATP-dependent DNA helicase RecQ
VSYYQQVGRAGRAIEHAHAVLLPSDADSGVWDYFATATIARPEQVERVLGALSGATDPLSVAALEAQTGLRRTRVELLLKQLAVDEVVDRVEGGWLPTGKEWVYDEARVEALLAVRRREAALMESYTRGASCLMELLQTALDDPHAEPCGRCSVCRGGLPDGLLAAPDPATVRTVATLLRSTTTVLEPRKMWPGGAFGARGRIAPDELAEEGRVLIHADAPEWAEARAVLAGPDGPLGEEVLEASVGLLSRWRQTWAERPEVVVGLPAGGRAAAVASVADHLAGVGRLERVDLAGVRLLQGDPPSGEEAAHWRDALSGPVDEVAATVKGRSVLLVVDATRSGWAVTIAAALLRRSGATVVLPMVLHRTV